MNDSKNSRRPSPRLICRAVRQWESLRGPADGNGQTWVAERHMETCDACQAFFAEDVAFEEMMRGAATEVSVEPRAGFEQRILRALREAETAPATRKASGRSWGISLAGAVAGVALAFMVSQNSGPEKIGPEVAGNQPATGNQELVTPEVSADPEREPPLRWLASVEARQSALELAKRNPLEEEIDSVYNDAQAVLGFLALNFLPSGSAESPSNLPREAGDARHDEVRRSLARGPKQGLPQQGSPPYDVCSHRARAVP